MKTRFYTQTLIALAVAVAAAACAVSQAQEHPIPPPADSSALPANIVPGSPLAEVVKLVQAGVDAGTINNYIVNSPSAFNLDADKIIFLKDVGVPSELVNAMMERDKILYASTITPAPATVSYDTSAPADAPPAQVTVNYFNDTLAPYGSWVEVDGYGRCWRPTVVNYDSGWRPYCDRGHWVYTDCGWYWDSDYSWGATFHYGRWFQNSSYGWCWYPDTVWAPSWVTWRSGGDYCGWAPLPPLAVYSPGIGFYYRGASVAVGFDFGLSVGCFTFVSQSHFYDRHPRYYCAAPQQATVIFNQTTVINNYNVHNATIVNNGISVQQISTGIHRPIQPVRVGELPNAERHGWRGEGFGHSAPVAGADNNSGRNVSTGNGQLRHGPVMPNDQNNAANENRHQTVGQPATVPNHSGNQIAAPRSASAEPAGNRNSQANRDAASRNSSPQSVNPPANSSGQTVYRQQRPSNPPATVNDHYSPSQPVAPVVPDRRPAQNNWPAGGNVQAQPQAQPRQFSAPATPDRTLTQNDSRPSRSVEVPVMSAPPQHYVAPSAPSQPRVEQHQSVAAPEAHTPPPKPEPAPAASQPRNTDRGSDRDKQNR